MTTSTAGWCPSCLSRRCASLTTTYSHVDSVCRLQNRNERFRFWVQKVKFQAIPAAAVSYEALCLKQSTSSGNIVVAAQPKKTEFDGVTEKEVTPLCVYNSPGRLFNVCLDSLSTIVRSASIYTGGSACVSRDMLTTN